MICSKYICDTVFEKLLERDKECKSFLCEIQSVFFWSWCKLIFPVAWQGGGRPYCIATYDFSGEAAEDLSFKAGSRIVLLKHINSEWLCGSLDGREGMFPAAFVNIVCDIDGGRSN